VQRCKGAKVQRCKGAKVQRCKGAKVQRCKGAKVQRCKGAKVQWKINRIPDSLIYELYEMVSVLIMHTLLFLLVSEDVSLYPELGKGKYLLSYTRILHHSVAILLLL
jgi:hypothetical protein